MIQTTFQPIGPVLQSELFLKQPGVEHYCSMQQSVDPQQGVWMPKQVHGQRIVVLEADHRIDHQGEPVEAFGIEADAVITQQPGQWIGVRTADCVPVLLCDAHQQAIAAIHAGWRGTVQHIVAQTLQTMQQHFGTQAEQVLAVIGPSISPEAFEVGEEVADAFQAAHRSGCIVRSDRQTGLPYAKPHIDLWESNRQDLLELGVSPEHIDCTPWCTFTNAHLLWSARKQGIQTGRIVSAIRLHPVL